MSASTAAFQRLMPAESSIVTCHASRRPFAVGCQPSLAGMGALEMPPRETRASAEAAPPLRMCSPDGSARFSPAAAASTASMALRSAESAAPPRLTGVPEAKTRSPLESTLTVTCPPKTSSPRNRWLKLKCVTPLCLLVTRLMTKTSAKSALVTPRSAALSSR